MLKNLKNKIKNRKGFTLVELIVVIAILAILAAIAIPKMGSFRTDAAKSTHNANVRTLESAAMMMLAENGSGTEITWDGTKATTPGDTDWSKYLQEWPTNPIKSGTGSGAYKVTIDTDGNVKVTPEAVEE